MPLGDIVDSHAAQYASAIAPYGLRLIELHAPFLGEDEAVMLCPYPINNLKPVLKASLTAIVGSYPTRSNHRARRSSKV
jgi:hypothetical protein